MTTNAAIAFSEPARRLPKEVYAALKASLKTDAEEIRKLKAERKSLPHGYVPGLWGTRLEWRIRHFALCLVRGRLPDDIESHRRHVEVVPNDHVEQILRRGVKGLLTRWGFPDLYPWGE